MHSFAAALIALLVTQQEPAPAPPAEPPRPAEESPAAPPPPPRDVAPTPSEPSPLRPAPTPPVAPRATPTAPATPPSAPAPASPPPRVVASPPLPPASVPPSANVPARPAAPVPEREQLLRTSLAFVEALLRGDASALAAASTPRFSFDGGTVDGRDGQARRWRELFASRGARTGEVLRDLVLLSPTEAVAQLGPPPPRLAPLAREGSWIAVADLSGRPVILFLARDGARFAVAGMSD